MIGGSLYPSWATIFSSVLFTIAIVMYYHVPFWRPSKNKKTLQSKRSSTLRIEGVQIDKSSDDLQRDLMSIIEGDPVLKQDAITVETHSIVPRDQKEACATATFHTSISRNEMMKRLCKAGASLPYRFDDNFQGIRPLYQARGVQMLSRYAPSMKHPAFAHLCHLYNSVIAVPGLGSHAIGSWKSPSDNDLWLRDYLPDDVPNIRVLLYGDNTSLLGNESKDSIENLGIRFLESIKAFRADKVCGS